MSEREGRRKGMERVMEAPVSRLYLHGNGQWAKMGRPSEHSNHVKVT